MLVKEICKPSWDMNLGYMGQCEGGRGPFFVLGHPFAMLFTDYDNDGLHQKPQCT